MILLTTNEIIEVHSKLIAKTGGLEGVKDFGLLDSANASAMNCYDNIEQYPTIEQKAARLAYAIISNHAFIDGNKRIGILVMLLTLKLNEYFIVYNQNELIVLGLSIADGSFKYIEIYKWIIEHKI